MIPTQNNHNSDIFGDHRITFDRKYLMIELAIFQKKFFSNAHEINNILSSSGNSLLTFHTTHTFNTYYYSIAITSYWNFCLLRREYKPNHLLHPQRFSLSFFNHELAVSVILVDLLISKLRLLCVFCLIFNVLYQFLIQ